MKILASSVISRNDWVYKPEDDVGQNLKSLGTTDELVLCASQGQ